MAKKIKNKEYFKLDSEKYFYNYNKYDGVDLSVVRDMFELGYKIGAEIIRKKLKLEKVDFYKIVNN